MTLDGARDALVAQLHNNWSTTPVFYENTTSVDLLTVGDYFVKFDIDWNGSKQANISPTPFDRTYGTVVLMLFAKQTTGTKQALQYLETLKTLMRFKNLGGVHTQAAGPGDGVELSGWASTSLRIPFYFDSNS